MECVIIGIIGTVERNNMLFNHYGRLNPVQTNHWFYPDSTNIYRYKYVRSSRTLQIVFKSNIYAKYVYYYVPERKFREMFYADSKGKYFHKNIKGQFEWDKINL